MSPYMKYLPFGWGAQSRGLTKLGLGFGFSN